MSKDASSHPFEAKNVAYRTLISHETQERLYAGIIQKMAVEKCYRLPGYTAAQLVKDLNTNPRHLSAVLNLRFNTSFSRLIGHYRVGEARTLLADPRKACLTIEEVGLTVGFHTRQSFYLAFMRETGTTPAVFREQALGK